MKHMGDLIKDETSNLRIVLMSIFGEKTNETQYVVTVLKIKTRPIL